MNPPLFTVSYDDEDYLFGDGDRRRFGRDDDACAIPIWEEIRRTTVSKVAGELWCMDGEMWVRALGVTSRQARRRIEELVSHYRGQLPELSEDQRHGEPLYAGLARLLVRRRCVTTEDLADLRVAP